MHTKEVWVPCGTCDGRGASLDIIERENGKRVLLRKPCPACLGRGLIDIARGPVTGNDYRCSAIDGAAHANAPDGSVSR